MNTETIIQNLKLVESITAQAIWENLVWGIFVNTDDLAHSARSFRADLPLV